MDIFERLASAREAAGYKTPADAAKALGKPYSTYAAHENGTKPDSAFRPSDGAVYAKKFKVEFLWLMTGQGPRKRSNLVDLVGHVGAGAEIIEEDPGPGGRYESIPAPPEAPTGCVAVSIKGDSMYPFEEGWVLFYRKTQDAGVPDDCIGKLCVVQVHGGSALVKKLRRGRSAGLWTLQSWNAEPREDVRLDWAARVLDIRPR